MFGSRRLQALSLVIMSLVGIAFGVWLLRAGFVFLGCGFIGVFLWRALQSAVWLVAPGRAPSNVTPRLNARWQHFLLTVVCLLGAGVCAVGLYLCFWWPEQWQAGFVIILFGLIVLVPVTIWQVQNRKIRLSSLQPK